MRQALASPPEGLQDEIQHYYYKTGHLKDVVDHAKALMEKEADVQNGSEGSARWDSDVIGSLTAGAKLSLKVRHHSISKSQADYSASLSQSGEVMGGTPDLSGLISDAHLTSNCHVRSLQCILMSQ